MEENDESEDEDIDVTGIDLPSKPNCSQLDFDMFAMSQSILDYVKQQDAINSEKSATETPPNTDLLETPSETPTKSKETPEINDLPETPPETPTKSKDMIFESFPSRWLDNVATFFELKIVD